MFHPFRVSPVRIAGPPERRRAVAGAFAAAILISVGAVALTSGSLGANLKLLPLSAPHTVVTNGEPGIAIDAQSARAQVTDSKENTALPSGSLGVTASRISPLSAPRACRFLASVQLTSRAALSGLPVAPLST